MVLPSTDMMIPTAQDDITGNDIDYATSSVENVIWKNVNILLTKATVNKNCESD